MSVIIDVAIAANGIASVLLSNGRSKRERFFPVFPFSFFFFALEFSETWEMEKCEFCLQCS